jgi:plasmid stabilization system protein ParE
MEALIKTYGVAAEDNLISKKDWIKIFENISVEKIHTTAEEAAQRLGWSVKEAEEGLKEYLRQIRSVIKNLKETPDAFFVRQYGGEKFEISKDGKRLLVERAEKHFENFKDLLQPVL